MVKDTRYTTVKKLISGGYITFQEIFDTLPKSIVAHDLGMNNTRFSKLINNLDRFVIKDVFRFAALLEVDEMALVNLLYQQYKADRKGKK